MRFLLKALTRVPLPVLYAVGTLIYFVLFHLMRWRREQVESDIQRAFPEKSPAERARILQQSYRNIADVVMEAIWGFGASAEALARRVTFENRDLVDAARAARQSVVLLTPHFCNWEWLLPAGGSYFSLPIDAVYQKQRVEFLDIFLRDARSRFGGKPIVREDFVYELMNRAATPRGYALIADQTPPRDDKKHWSRFLNRDTAFFIGAEKVARFLDSPVLYVAMRRVARGRYSVRFYQVAILFLVFDIEAAFMYPWAVLYEQLSRAPMGGISMYGFVEMLLFVAILVVALAYVWRKKAIGWE